MSYYVKALNVHQPFSDASKQTFSLPPVTFLGLRQAQYKNEMKTRLLWSLHSEQNELVHKAESGKPNNYKTGRPNL